MEENLIELVKSSFFSDNPKVNQKQILNILNKKCSKEITFSLSNLIKEIDETLNSNYVKEIERRNATLEQESCNLLKEIDKSIISIEKLQSDGNTSIENSTDIVKSIKDRYDEIHLLELQYQLIENQEKIMEIISNIQSALILEDIQLASEQMADFIDSMHTLGNCNNTKQVISTQLHKYHKTIEDQLTKLFEDCMTEIRWPFISNGLLRTSSQLDTEELDMISDKFSQIFRNLYLIELPDDLQNTHDKRKDFINTKFLSQLPMNPVCLPLRLLLRPLVQYFRYFFWTESKVNKMGKPEWYMTQVIQWISIHQSALDHMFTTSILECIDVKLEFIRALVIVVMEKVYKDLELTKTNDDLFFHLIEEALTMTIDLRRQFDYPESYPDLIDAVCNDDANFDHWMMLEQRFALKQLDEIFLSPGSWRPLSTKCKRIECLESFTGLLVSMKERIECVSDVCRQSRFCQVLLEILESFRLRLVQISKNYDGNTKRCHDIMNVVLCVKTFLRGWRLDRVFIEVHEYNGRQRKNQDQSRSTEDKRSASVSSTDPSTSHLISVNSSSIYTNRIRHIESRQLENDSLFSSILSLYQHVLDGLETTCVNAKFTDLSLRAEPYIKRSWLTTGPCDSPGLMSLSPSASGMLLVLRDHLHELDKALEPELFDNVWQSLAHRLNQLLYKEVILSHRFTESGALQLDFDIKKNLLPLLIPYTKTPERFFVDCLEASILLNLKWGTVVLIKDLLRETLCERDSAAGSSESSRSECPIRALNELGIFNLPPDVAQFLINLRIDPNLK